MKNRKKANIILAALMTVFILLAVLKHYFGEPFIMRMLVFIVEAALVGSIADWFAITALFERPLELPIKPLIPSNREKILSNLSNIVNNNLLDMNYIQNTIGGIPISESLIRIVDERAAMPDSKNLLLSEAMNVLNSLKEDKTKAAKFIDYIKESIEDVNFNKVKVLEVADKCIDKYFTKSTYDRIIDKTILLLKKDTTYIRMYNFLDTTITEKAGNKFALFGGIKNFVNTDNLTRAVQQEGINFLRELKISDESYDFVKGLIGKYSDDQLEKADLKEILVDFINNLDIEKHLDTVLTHLEALLNAISECDDRDANTAALQYSNIKAAAEVITDMIKDLWKAIKNDSEILSWVDSVIKELVLEVISKNRFELSKFIEERIKGFTDAQLISLIEESAGEPLHWIRINGAVLGATVGLILFSFINFLYEPFILPLTHKFLGLL